MSQPTRSGRGIIVPGIDTHSAGDQEYDRPQQERAFSPWPLTPSSSQDSRRPSLAFSSFHDGSQSGASSVSSFSQPATPMHSMASSTENFHRQWHDAAADMHASMADALENTCMVSQPGPTYHLSLQPHGLPMPAPMSLPDRPFQMATNPSVRSNAWNHTPPASFNAIGLGDTLYQSVPGAAQQQTPMTPMYASPSRPAQAPVQQSMFPDHNALADYHLQPQVVVPSQLGPQDAYHMVQYNGYSQDDGSAHDMSQSFDSSDADTWEAVTSQSPMENCVSPTDVRYDGIKKEFIGTPFRSSSRYSTPHSFPVYTDNRAQLSSAKKPRKSKHGNVFGHAFNAGIEIELAGPYWAVHTDEAGKVYVHTNSMKRNKPHRCDFVKPDGTECGSTFDRSEHLKRHSKTHSGVKDPCPLAGCGWAITRTDNMCQHLRTHLKECRKGARNHFWELDDVCQCIRDSPNFTEKAANKLISNLRKPVREKSDRTHGRSDNRKRAY